MEERHQRPIPFLQVFDARTHRDNAADPFRAHDRRQPWPITITASDQQKVVLIDRRGLDLDHYFAGHWRTDVGEIDNFDDLGRVAVCLDLDSFHGCSLHRR